MAPGNTTGIIWLEWEFQDPQHLPVGLVFPNPADHFHVTLQFGVPMDPSLEAQFGGRLIQVIAESNSYNERIQALSVSLPPELAPYCRNAHPHMTLSMASGVRPVESNQMLASRYSGFPLEETLYFRLAFQPFSR